MRSVIPIVATLFVMFGVWGCSGDGGAVDAGSDGADGGDGFVSDGGDPGPGPLLESVAPAEGPAAGGTQVTLVGSEFQPGASVRFGAVVIDGVQVVSDSSIEATTPSGSPGAVAIRVTNPDGQFSELSGAFTYLAPVQGDCPRATGCDPAPAVFRYNTGNPLDQVHLAGDFTGWRDGAIPMQHMEAGRFEAAVTLREGRYEYKFIVNDSDWVTDPTADEEPFFSNSVRYHDNPCTPNLVDPVPAYGEITDSGDVVLQAGYQDAESGAGIDPPSVCLVVDGVRVRTGWDEESSSLMAELSGLAEGDHHWWMSAADLEGHRSAEVSGFFTVNTAGEIPVASAGPTQFVYPGEWVILDGTWSRDPDGIAITGYQWTQTEGFTVILEPQHVTPHDGYDYDPGAEPPRTEALMGFAPPNPGTYRFQLVVSDADGSSDPADAEVIVLDPGTGQKPQARLDISGSGGQVSVTASADLSGTDFKWYPDVTNPGEVSLPAGDTLDLGAGDLPEEGTYTFHLVASKVGDSRPETVLIFKRGETVSASDFNKPPEWLQDAVIYEIYVRAFADGDGDGDGDFRGLLEKLDYLEDLGVDTLWLMPVFESADHAHGYHTMNYRRVERDYGNNDDLAGLLQAAHERGMRIVLDLVINHTSRQHPRFQLSTDSESRFRDDFIWFVNHSPGDPLIQRYGFGRELGGSRLTVESGWADIPDCNLSSPVSRDWLFGVARYWMDPDGDGDFTDGVDGFRLDHVTGPAHRVWKNLRHELKSIRPDVLLLAEVFRDFDNGGQGYGIKDYYRGEFDLAFTFPFYWMAEGVFTRGEAIGGCPEPCALDWLMNAISDRFRTSDVMCFFIENHDVPWFNTVFEYWGQSEGKLTAAATLMHTLPNSPQILYGQELGTSSWRGAMPWYKDDGTNQLKEAYRTLIHLRRDNPALRRGEYQRLSVNPENSPDVFAFARIHPDQTLVVVVNVRGDPAPAVTVDLTPLESAETLADLMGGDDWPVSGGQLESRQLAGYASFVGLLQ